MAKDIKISGPDENMIRYPRPLESEEGLAETKENNFNMAKEYKPTRKEIIGEMWNGVRNTFSKDNIHRLSKNIGSNIWRFSVGYGIGTGFMLSWPYAIPLYYRLLSGSSGAESSEPVEIDASVIGGISGMITGAVGDLGQIAGYYYAVKEDHPEFLLIPVATNVASGVYEIGRKVYNNARQKVIEKHKPEGLEATLETAEPARE